jgi:hypothetical protein
MFNTHIDFRAPNSRLRDKEPIPSSNNFISIERNKRKEERKKKAIEERSK